MKAVRNIIFILVISMLALTWGCTSQRPLQQNWGQSFESITYSQVLHPEAGGIQPVEGLGGQSAQQVNTQYQEMFKKPEALQSTTTQ